MRGSPPHTFLLRYMGRTIFSFLFILLFSLIISSCKEQHTFTVEGRVTQPRLEGQQIFLVPMDNDVKARIGVDSVYIKDMKFKFEGDEEFLGRLTLDIKVRRGTQDLLIVTEPGTIDVLIDSISVGGGTRQNEVLQTWKDRLGEHEASLRDYHRHLNYLRQKGDTTYMRLLTDTIRQSNITFKHQMQDLAKTLEEGPAYDLLMQRYGNNLDK